MKTRHADSNEAEDNHELPEEVKTILDARIATENKSDLLSKQHITFEAKYSIII